MDEINLNSNLFDLKRFIVRDVKKMHPYTVFKTLLYSRVCFYLRMCFINLIDPCYKLDPKMFISFGYIFACVVFTCYTGIYYSFEDFVKCLLNLAICLQVSFSVPGFDGHVRYSDFFPRD